VREYFPLEEVGAPPCLTLAVLRGGQTFACKLTSVSASQQETWLDVQGAPMQWIVPVDALAAYIVSPVSRGELRGTASGSSRAFQVIACTT
jgi:hypothetical protein